MMPYTGTVMRSPNAQVIPARSAAAYPSSSVISASPMAPSSMSLPMKPARVIGTSAVPPQSSAMPVQPKPAVMPVQRKPAVMPVQPKPAVMPVQSKPAALPVKSIAARGPLPIGSRVPSVELHCGFPPEKVNLAERTKGKRMIIVGLPGAFTPT